MTNQATPMQSRPPLSGAVCTCGAVIFGPPPDVHRFIAHHPMRPEDGHTGYLLLPGQESHDVARLIAQALNI
jgi:hypothetical protein